MPTPDIYEQKRISMLSPELCQLEFPSLIKSQFEKAGCTRGDGKPWEDVFEKLKVERTRVATASKEFGTYNHQSGICHWKGKYSVNKEHMELLTVDTNLL